MVLPKPTRTSEPGGTSTRYFVGLDGLRGIAVLAVLGYHFGASFLTGGYLGVDVFFVVSGFVVTRNLRRLVEEPGWARVFYGRRVSRLYPVLLAFLVALTLLWLLSGELGGDAAVAIVGGALMSYNLALAHLGAAAEGPLHLWSLGVEWHFYLLAPFLLVAGGRRLSTMVRALALVAGAGLVAGVRLALLMTDSVDSLTVYLHTLTRLDGLLLGCAVALVPTSILAAIPFRRALGLLLGGLLVAMVAGPAWGARPPLTLGLIVPIVGVLSAAAVIAVVNRPDGDDGPILQTIPHSVLESPLLVWVGRRSYSLYVWHYFIGVSLIARGDEAWQGWPVFSLQVALSVVAAELSYRYIEHPARRVINRRL